MNLVCRAVPGSFRSLWSKHGLFPHLLMVNSVFVLLTLSVCLLPSSGWQFPRERGCLVPSGLPTRVWALPARAELPGTGRSARPLAMTRAAAVPVLCQIPDPARVQPLSSPGSRRAPESCGCCRPSQRHPRAEPRGFQNSLRDRPHHNTTGSGAASGSFCFGTSAWSPAIRVLEDPSFLWALLMLVCWKSKPTSPKIIMCHKDSEKCGVCS